MELKEMKINDCVFNKENGKYIIKYWENEIWTDWYSESYDWIGNALEAIRTMDKKYWNMENLILLRQALREDCVQGWGIQEEMIWDFIEENNNKLNKRQFDRFIKMARRNDKKHHGTNTF